MKHVIAGIVLAFLAVVSAAAQDFDAERKRIRKERAEAGGRFEVEEKACYGRFAVTDCVEAARKQRNARVSALRREEVALNDAERKLRAAERAREIEERRAAERTQDTEERRARAEAEQKSRDARAAGKAEQQAERAAQPAAQPASQRRVEPLAPQGTPRASKAFDAPRQNAAEDARNRQAFEERRRQAEAHKAEVLERNAKRDKPRAPDLPPP